jgi:hypothetical protein
VSEKCLIDGSHRKSECSHRNVFHRDGNVFLDDQLSRETCVDIGSELACLAESSSFPTAVTLERVLLYGTQSPVTVDHKTTEGRNEIIINVCNLKPKA